MMAGSSASLRVAVICHEDDPINRQILPRWLATFSTVSGIVTIREQPRVLLKRVRSEIRRVGLARFLDVLAFRLHYRLFVAKDDARWEQQELSRLDRTLPPLVADIPVLETRNPNEAPVEDFLKRVQPDIVIARCSWLLRSGIHGIPPFGTFVLHPGICPEYRNAHGCFWALAHRDVDKVGMTLLRIDDGIDTGPVYAYFTYPFDECRESHIRIQYRMLTENLENIRQSLEAIAAGTAAPLSVVGRSSKNWGQPWLTAYLRWKRQAAAAAGSR